MTIKFLDQKDLKDFALGSGIASFEERIYLVGADAGYAVVMNKDWDIKDSIKLRAGTDLFNVNTGSQAGYYAATMVIDSKVQSLLVLGSGAAAGNGLNKGVLMNLKTKEYEDLDLSVFYSRLKETGLEEINISAAVVMDDKMILCNSSDKNAKDNRLLVTSTKFWKNQQDAEIFLIKIELDEDKVFMQLNGIAYSYENDWLIVSASMRKLFSKAGSRSVEEYNLGIIESGYRKIDRKRIKFNEIFNLAQTNNKFKGQEIKSLCLQADKNKKLKLHMVAGDDAGKRTIFKIRLKDNS